MLAEGGNGGHESLVESSGQEARSLGEGASQKGWMQKGEEVMGGGGGGGRSSPESRRQRPVNLRSKVSHGGARDGGTFGSVGVGEIQVACLLQLGPQCR